MKTLDSPDFYGHTIFCDDIRREVGEKASYIGVYTGHMFVLGNFPFVLPKFGFAMHYVQRVRSYIPPTKFLIFLPGTSPDDPDNPSIELELAEPIIPTNAVQAGLDGDEHAVRNFAVHHMAAPLILQEPGVIFVRALRGNEGMVRLGALHVAPAPFDPASS